ncbi:hypothetical protein OTU49_009894 [Cherax quadricarinatus]|uniref:Uncharacterized protein n=1 Tax=Cherax quadricarinatus TaxID=27406 RepID=A0AAW0Y4C9_CHEQU
MQTRCLESLLGDPGDYPEGKVLAHSLVLRVTLPDHPSICPTLQTPRYNLHTETGARCAVFNNRGLGGVQLKPGRIVQPTVMTWKKPLNTYARSTLRLHSWLLASLSEA